MIWPPVVGVHAFPDEQDLLVELIVVDEHRRGNWFGVQEHDVRQACAEFDLDYPHIMMIIRNKESDTHTLLIDAPTYRKERNRG